MAEKKGDTVIKQGKALTETNNGKLDKSKKAMSNKDAGTYDQQKKAKKNAGTFDQQKKAKKETFEGKSDKSEEVNTEKDDETLDKMEEEIKQKDDETVDKMEEEIKKKDNETLDKSEEVITEKDDETLDKCVMKMSEKDDNALGKNGKAETIQEGKNKKAKNVPERKAEEQSTASRLKKCFHSVQVSKHDATKVQRGLEGEIFDNWSEGCEVMNAKKIAFSNMKNYLEYMKEAYEGIDDEVLKDINDALFQEESWEFKMVEWKCKQSDESKIRYGMVAFGRSKDKQYVDCMYVLYKMNFEVTPHEIVTEKKHSWFCGLHQYTTQKVEFVEKNIDSRLIQDMQNFFRVKVLEGIYKEGLIDSINFVDSSEEIPDLKSE